MWQLSKSTLFLFQMRVVIQNDLDVFLSSNQREFAICHGRGESFFSLGLHFHRVKLRIQGDSGWVKTVKYLELWLRCHQSYRRLNLDFKELWIRIFWLHWNLIIALRQNLLCFTDWWQNQKINSDHIWLLRQVQTDKGSCDHTLRHLLCKSSMLVYFRACINKPYFPSQLSEVLRPLPFYNIIKSWNELLE